ncbi:hypothetical protein CPB83DRAFT_837040 [Crepidotus variabilis]|uniref:Uncharacterized protein n=1 Tax=Crepidotus variabilis TaxID=179855 RepID=A0A9P6ED69_9AGAR|nr:hypothetical protein CPB83DRAFT_837040 [Crepidotus variabilis]
MSSESRHTLPNHHPLPDSSEKEYSPRQLNFGLLSPNPSLSSLSSSASYSTSSLNQQPHYAPRTPLRSVYRAQPPASPARPSPLFRLLLPPSPLPAHTSRPSSPIMLHQPSPQYSQPDLPATSPRQLATVPNTRSSSRSERLLRNTLLKDEIDRTVANVPLPTSPLLASPMTSPSTKAHRRRHSHVPTSGTAASHDPQREREEYLRGSYMFRTAINNPRPASPSSSSTGGAAQHVMYGGDAEGHTSSRQQRALSPVSNTRSRRSGFSPTRDVSPSPMRRRQDDLRPTPLPLDSHTSGLQRHHTIHTSPRGSGRTSRRPHSPNDRSAPARGEPLAMTPHEQVLRARLEKVLNSGKVANGKDRVQRHERGRSQSGSRRSNEVMDEEGGWPWKEREVALKSGGSMTSSPLQSSNSGSSLSQSSASHPQQLPTFATGMKRARSKTDPTPPTLPTHRSAAPSPRRTSTAPSGVASPSYSSRKLSHHHTGTTPPLVSDSSPLLGPSTPGIDEEEGELALMTPPPTPPCTSKTFALNGNGAVRQDSYCPSPYKTGFPSTTRRDASKTQGAPRLGSVRRPTNVPVGDRYSSRSSERQHVDDCDDERSSSCSSRSFPGSDDFFVHHAHHLPNSPSADLPVPVTPEMRPQFNARKASAQCRAIDGYVSFANIEGLGMPPDDPSAGDSGHGDGRRRGEHERGRSMFAWGVGGFRRLLGVAQLEGGDREHPQQNADGVVV